MPILTFLLQNGTVNDADEVNELVQELEAVLDGGILPANLDASFTLDSQTQLTNNLQEIHLTFKIDVATTMTTGFKDYHTLISGAYTVIGAYLTVQLQGSAPTGTMDISLVAGSYVASAWVTTATIINSVAVYSTTPTRTSGAMSVSTASITGPKTLALSVDAIPSSNPPNSGHVELTLVLVRKLQA